MGLGEKARKILCERMGLRLGKEAARMALPSTFGLCSGFLCEGEERMRVKDGEWEVRLEVQVRLGERNWRGKERGTG